MKKTLSLFMTMVLVLISPLTSLASNLKADTAETTSSISESNDFLQIGDNYIEIVEDSEIIIINQYDSSENLIYTSTANRDTGMIIDKNVSTDCQTVLYATSDCSSMTSSTASDVEPLSTTAYTNMGKMVLVLNGELTIRTMKVTYAYTKTGDTTTCTYSRYSGSLASFISSIAISLAVSSKISGNIASALISAAICLLVDSVITLTSSISLSCNVYRCKFRTYDVNDNSYLASQYYGYMYVVNDSNHAEFTNKQFYEGVTTYAIKSGDFTACQTLINATYGKNGIIDCEASTVFD